MAGISVPSVPPRALSGIARRAGLCLFLCASLGVLPALAQESEDSPAASPGDDTPSAPIEDAGAARTIDSMHAGFLDVMKRADELGFDGRTETLTTVVESAFDLEFMAMKSLGSAGKKLSEEEKAAWVGAFTGFIASNYARNFTGFTGQRFEILEETDAPRGQVVLQTRVLPTDREAVRLDYRMREIPGVGWRIIDIYARGSSSILSVRRAEFSSFLEEQGIEALIASVTERSAESAE